MKFDIKYFVDCIYEFEVIWFFDFEIIGVEEIIFGVWCEFVGVYIEGLMNVIVEIVDGMVCICGDVIYDFND